jgi:hypothetical protein
MDNKALKLIKDYDKPSITMALMLIMELGKTEIINKDSKELFDSLKKSTSNFLSDNYRENIIDVAKKIANLNSNQFRDIMNYTMINETNKKHVKERVK